ncbi:unnamed protein product [Paramecium octaurelia]|uniref:Uncharacterized protein n=1 Tax=Paramecium octaurelia TaxID=43137 RepID=A0A8S1SSH5_PAROT|nr:unnamed protein product [Paramecium octaurelia]
MNFMNTHSQFNIQRKTIPRPTISRQFTREKSQTNFNPATPSTKFRITNSIQQINRDKIQKVSGNYFNQNDDTTGSTKMSKGMTQQLLKKHEIEFKQSWFEQEDREEEIQFALLLQTLDKIL